MRAAKRWLEQATATVATLRASAGDDMPGDVLDEFEQLLDQWRGSVDRGDEFRWQARVPVERVRRLSTYWAAAARAARSPGSGLVAPPPETRPFYEALVVGVATALQAAEAHDDDGVGPTFLSVVPEFRQRLAAPPPAAARRRVLVVDDTADIRLLVRFGLRGHADLEIVGEAVDGVDAIEQAAELRPDVVLLDIAMPRMTGLEALPQLRAHVPDARVVVYSADPDKAWSAHEAGADAFVRKGIAIDELAAVLLGAAGERSR